MKDKGVEGTPVNEGAAGKPHAHEGWRDAWVRALVRDPKEIPATRLVVGYVGDSPDAGRVRVFLDAQLRTALDIPEDGILHREPIPQSVSPLGGSYLWIDERSWTSVVWLSLQH